MEIIGAIIPIMIFAIPLLAIWTHHQRKMRAIDSRQDPQVNAEIAALRSRIETLEQIVIENNSGLASKFRELG